MRIARWVSAGLVAALLAGCAGSTDTASQDAPSPESVSAEPVESPSAEPVESIDPAEELAQARAQDEVNSAVRKRLDEWLAIIDAHETNPSSDYTDVENIALGVRSFDVRNSEIVRLELLHVTGAKRSGTVTHRMFSRPEWFAADTAREGVKVARARVSWCSDYRATTWVNPEKVEVPTGTIWREIVFERNPFMGELVVVSLTEKEKTC